MNQKIPVFFHPDQLNHKPLFEWAFGEKIAHPETTHRAESILAALTGESSFYEILPPVKFPTKYLTETHNKKLVDLLRTAVSLPVDQTFYPQVFPKRDSTTSVADPQNIHHAGFFCFDSGTPLNSTTFGAAAWSAACADEAAKVVEMGKSPVSYALCRPPGHHATRDLFGGYCYFNNAALAAKRLRKKGKVLILDIDFHHGNGTQSLFYRDEQVMVINIHGDPSTCYPYFSGFASEKGAGQGEGFNLNIPLPPGCDGQAYLRVIEERVIPAIQKYQPSYLIVSAGFDTYVSDPVGDFALETADYPEIAGRLARLGIPIVVVQEGGYEATSLGTNVEAFLRGFQKKAV